MRVDKVFHFIFMLFVAIDLLSYLNIFCAIFYGIRTKGGFLLEHDVHSRLHLGGGEGGADDTVTSGEGHNMTPPCLPRYSCLKKALQFHLLVFR